MERFSNFQIYVHTSSKDGFVEKALDLTQVGPNVFVSHANSTRTFKRVRTRSTSGTFNNCTRRNDLKNFKFLKINGFIHNRRGRD